MQFVTKAVDKNQAETLFKLLLKYRPEDKAQKRERLKAEAEARAAGENWGLEFAMHHDMLQDAIRRASAISILNHHNGWEKVSRCCMPQNKAPPGMLLHSANSSCASTHRCAWPDPAVRHRQGGGEEEAHRRQVRH